MSNEGNRGVRPGTRFTTEGRMRVDPRGIYATPSEGVTVMVSLELAGETLDRFRSFVGRGYPQVPHRVPPTNAEGFEDLNFVEEMRENLLDAWEAAEDLGVEEEIHRVRLAVEELTFALASEETRAAEENE